jgi:hypothetical protein
MGPSLLPWNAPPRDTSAHSWSFSSSVFQSWRSTSNLAALSKSSRTPFTSTTSIGSCEVKLDEGRHSEEDDSKNGDTRNVSKGHGSGRNQ